MLVGLGFRLINLVVDRQFTPGEKVVSRLDLVPARLRRIGFEEADSGHGACVYKGVERSALMQFQGNHRVERLTCGVATDLAAQGLRSHFIEYMGEGEYLGNRLDGEGVIGVADFCMGTVAEHDADAEQMGWH